jgi:hypothetical protein
MTIDHFELAGVINDECLKALDSAPALVAKNLYVEQALDQLLGHYDWSVSFSTPVVLIYDELVTSEILIILHNWLRRKCADIENIQLIVTSHTGIAKWWKSWCQTNHEKSFQINELFFTISPSAKKYFKNFTKLPELDFYRQNKKISKLFSFYGGTYSGLEKEYLILKILEFKNSASIDFFAKFSSKQEILDYAEHINYYKNQKEIDYISYAYDTYVQDCYLNYNQSLVRTKNEPIDFKSLQWTIDKICWASIVRETVNGDKFASLTEKTLRAYLHHNVVIPTGFNAVTDLEDLGFWFPHDIVDYSYQSEPLYANRINQMIQMLTHLNNTYSFDQLHNYYIDNLQKFQHNAILIQNYIDQQNNLNNNFNGNYYEKIALHGVGSLQRSLHSATV